MPLLRRTPVGIDPERIAGLLPTALADPRQTGGAQQGGSGIERHAGVRGLGAGVAAADGELSGGVALCGQNGDGVLPSLYATISLCFQLYFIIAFIKRQSVL